MTTDGDRATDALHRMITEREAEIARLRQLIAEKDEAIRLAMKTLEVPAAEYVPALNDAWDVLKAALEKS